MKLFTCCLILLPLVGAAPAKARRENVLSFLNDAFAAVTVKSPPVAVTAHRSSPSKPVDQLDSEDMSDDKSAELVSKKEIKEPKVPETKPGDDSTDIDSDETQTPKPAVKPGKKPDEVKAAQRGDGRTEHADSDEVIVPDPRQTNKLPKKQMRSRVFQKEVVAVVVAGPSAEVLDPDSVEESNGRLVVNNQGATQLDDTREHTSADVVLVVKKSAARQKKTRSAATKRRATS